MKYGKEFMSQMVPEWQEAYLNYNHLKIQLKEIQDVNPPPPPPPAPAGLRRDLTLYRAFSGLTNKSPLSPAKSTREHHHHHHHHHLHHHHHHQVIIVKNVGEVGAEQYETTYLEEAEHGGLSHTAFFEKLDQEFNKVLKFYKQKVEEVRAEALGLTKQMHALIAFRVKVENPQGWKDSLQESSNLASGIAASAAALNATTPSSARVERTITIDEIDEESATDTSDDNKDVEQIDAHTSVSGAAAKRPASLEVLDRVKLHEKIEREKELKFSRRNLRKAEEQLKQAFTEFYHKLMLLRSYSFHNVMAISKILKKYDKVTSKNASKTYMEVVDNSHLGSSDEVSRLMEKVESTFIKHFTDSNRGKAMSILRPQKKREKHRLSFLIGFLCGGTVALILGLISTIHAHDLLEKEGKELYMETVFPLYSVFGFIVLHMMVFAANIYFWRRYRINYPFIFGIKEGTELGYREVLLVASGLSVLALGCVISNLDLEMDPVTLDYKALTELLPAALLVLLIAIMMCPFNIVYRPTRFFLLGCIYRCLLAPLYKVSLPDFFLGDQLTSQVQAFRSLEFYICYYGWGDFRLRHNTCYENKIFISFYYFVAALPYLLRLLQCLRRVVEEKNAWQGCNGLKYFTTILAVCSRTAYSKVGGVSWMVTAWITSVTATAISTYWDLVQDWGLFRRSSKNPWLRDRLLLPYKSVYFAAMILNVLLRLAWMQTVMNISIFSLHKQAVAALVASLEIIRRGMWNFFRLENEHLNNVGKYRAFKTVPLPFYYEEDKDE
ncbi:phosphate transporter PHO1 homolog 3-like isoform X2 [Andrographis paniculata]|uniref:phosphate transporter PHO1 homolog 3-like isoform X2 n=1 Tax=Andrographis paniculata TaxID=175694 RepID=UPI0021E74CAD|nr:phosphate transporter PHO1 homolog 3-like isoform X2 [Andrographis paniculata]